MQKYENSITVRAAQGILQAVAGATVQVRAFPALTDVVLYSDNGVTAYGIAGTTLTTDANGKFSFYAADGRYQIDYTASGITPGTISDVLLEDPVDAEPVAVTVLRLTDGVAAPAATPGVAQLYVDTADGDLKVIFGDGIVKTLATDT